MKQRADSDLLQQQLQTQKIQYFLQMGFFFEHKNRRQHIWTFFLFSFDNCSFPPNSILTHTNILSNLRLNSWLIKEAFCDFKVSRDNMSTWYCPCWVCLMLPFKIAEAGTASTNCVLFTSISNILRSITAGMCTVPASGCLSGNLKKTPGRVCRQRSKIK